MTDPVAPSPPALLVPAADREELVRVVRDALVAEVGADPARDAAKVDRAVRAAIESVETFLDRETSFALADLPVRVQAALIQLSAGDLRRPGFAYGLAGYDEADPSLVRAYGAIRSELAPGLKARWGVA